MNKKLAIFLTSFFALISMFFLHSDSKSEINIYIGISLALISMGIGIFNLLLKEKDNSKKNHYVIIILIGLIFWAVGLFIM